MNSTIDAWVAVPVLSGHFLSPVTLHTLLRTCTIGTLAYVFYRRHSRFLFQSTWHPQYTEEGGGGEEGDGEWWAWMGVTYGHNLLEGFVTRQVGE